MQVRDLPGVVQETTELVEKGYMGSLELLQTVTKLFIMAYFIFQENPSAIVPMVVMMV